MSNALIVNPEATAAELFDQASLFSCHIDSIATLLAESKCEFGSDLAGTLYAMAALNDMAKELYYAAHQKQKAQKGGE